MGDDRRRQYGANAVLGKAADVTEAAVVERRRLEDIGDGHSPAKPGGEIRDRQPAGIAERRHTEAMSGLEEKRTSLERKIEELRTFEREYRTRLRSYLESHLRDLDSRGGTTLTYPGREPQRMRPHDAYVLEPGTVLDLAQVYAVRFETGAVAR